jgi:hypothetical protein
VVKRQRFEPRKNFHDAACKTHEIESNDRRIVNPPDTSADHEVIGVGDVVHIPPEEKHWHGATPDSSFSHIALTAKGSTTTQVEK